MVKRIVALKASLLPTVAGLAILTANLKADDNSQGRPELNSELRLNIANLPLAFTPNVGQDEEGIRFSSRGFGHGIFFTRQETILDVSKREGKGSVLTLKVAGADPNTSVSGAEALPAKTNYLLGRDPERWHTGVANYAKIVYKQILPGIDLIYYG